MGRFGEWLGLWYESGGIRLKHGTRVCIGGEYKVTEAYAGMVGNVVGLARERFMYERRFLVDLGGMCVEVPPGDVHLERGNPKDVSSGFWDGSV